MEEAGPHESRAVEKVLEQRFVEELSQRIIGDKARGRREVGCLVDGVDDVEGILRNLLKVGACGGASLLGIQPSPYPLPFEGRGVWETRAMEPKVASRCSSTLGFDAGTPLASFFP